MRRQAITRLAWSARSDARAVAASRTSDAESAPRARARYRRCSIGCTNVRYVTHRWLGYPAHGSLRSLAVATKLPEDLSLAPLGGEARDLAEWLTTFHMASVVLDPYTNESSWLLKTAVRILEEFRGSHARVNFIVTAADDDAAKFLGPLTERFLVFCDPDRDIVKAMGLEQLPAFAFIRVDREVVATAEGWTPADWLTVAEAIADTTKWNVPTIPAPGDPVAFAGSPATG